MDCLGTNVYDKKKICLYQLMKNIYYLRQGAVYGFYHAFKAKWEDLDYHIKGVEVL